MPEQLQKNFSIDIQQKLYEKDTPQGCIGLYQTTALGMLLTLNGQVVLSEQDGFFYHEMLAHPALFTHAAPKRVAILGHHFGVLDEVLKHPSVQEVTCIAAHNHLDEAVARYFSPLLSTRQDARVTMHFVDTQDGLSLCQPDTFDVLIHTSHDHAMLQENFQRYQQVLHTDGILVQPCAASLLQLNTLKPIFQNMAQAGFHDRQTLNFPQPSYPMGWRTVLMATKQPRFQRIREKDIYNRAFTTRYYNFDTHKAALVLPEFARVENEKVA